MAQYDLKGFDSVHDPNPNNEIQDNLIEFFDWGLLNKGNYFNVTLGETSSRGDDYSRLRIVDTKRYVKGQAWKGFRKNWVWQSGVNYSPSPLVGSDNTIPGISGVYVDDTFYPSNTAGSYSHYVDYYNGTVVFNSPIPTGSKVQAEFSYKWINMVYANELPWLRDIQYRSYNNAGFLDSSRKEFDAPADTQVQLPAIAVEIVPRRDFRGYQLGGGQFLYTDVLFHCVAEDERTRNKMVDIVSRQNDKTIFKFNSKEISKWGDFPLNYKGTPNSGALRYPDLTSKFYDGKIRLTNASVQGMDMINSNLYGGVVKLTTEVIDVKI